MMPKYEKPVALPLGEAARGSGGCNTGSGVGPIARGGMVCASGGSPAGCCQSGLSPRPGCAQGFGACNCWTGSAPDGVCSNGLSFV